MPDFNEKALEAMTFEDAMKELEQVVERLEEGGLSLEHSIKDYEMGMRLKAHCEKKLKEATLKVEKITLGAQGETLLTPFDHPEQS